jgi:hypothetical protein
MIKDLLLGLAMLFETNYGLTHKIKRKCNARNYIFIS